MWFFLAYVNLPSSTDYTERKFETMGELVAYVNARYPDWTSYSITVLKDNPPQH